MTVFTLVGILPATEQDSGNVQIPIADDIGFVQQIDILQKIATKINKATGCQTGKFVEVQFAGIKREVTIQIPFLT